MPARTTTRATRTARTGAGTRTARAAAVEIPDEGPVTSLRIRIAQVFSDAQKTTATQRKLAVTLRKIQEKCVDEPATAKKGRKAQEEESEHFDADDFNEELLRVILRVMNVKRSESAGDRVIRFLTMFLKHATEKDHKLSAALEEQGEPVPETLSERLIPRIFKLLLPLIYSKDKTVRLRATQTIAQITNTLEHLDPDLFALIKVHLSKRLRDKEASVRVQAILGLGRLIDDDDDEEEEDSDDEAGSIRDKLADIMANDPDPQVRRVILRNLPYHKSTLRSQLERARDLDPASRRIVYTHILPNIGDFRHLSLIEREKLIRWGLRDRDDSVRKAAAQLFCENWIEYSASSYDTRPEEEKVEGANIPPSRAGLCELIERIDLPRSGREGGMAHEAMKEFWKGRPDYLEAMEFDAEFWLKLDPPGAFLVRTLNDYGQATDDDRVRELIEDKLPTVSGFAVSLQKHLNLLAEDIERFSALDEDDPTLDNVDEDVNDRTFVVNQLLQISLTLDFSDELGRRQMYNLTRDAVGRASLPDESTRVAIEVLRIVCGKSGEADFCALISEAIAEVRDTLADEDDDTTEVGDGAESFHSAQSERSSPAPAATKAPKSSKNTTPEERAMRELQETAVYRKCLCIVHYTLQNVTCDIETNTNLRSMLNTLIIPAVQDQGNPVIRELGVLCLGSAALLNKDLAVTNLPLFFYCYNKGHEDLKVIVLQALCDMVMIHPQILAPPEPDPDTTEQSEVPEQSPAMRPLIKALLRGLDSDDAQVGQTACDAAQKLVFFDLLPPDATEDIVRAFTMKYFDPDGIQSPAMKQGVTYFIPAFCHSKIKNATLMAGITVSIVSRLLVNRDELVEEEEGEMVGWPIITAQLADWTDGRKVVGQSELGLDGKTNWSVESELPHLTLAVDILERALTNTCSKEERKPLLSLLTKLHISATAPKTKDGETADTEYLEAVQELVAEAVENSIGVDATQRNALIKLDATLTKRLGDAAVVQEEREDTVTPETAKPSETPAAELRASVARSSVAPSADASDMEVDDDDTMLAGMQGESTRVPLNPDDSESDDAESTPRPTRKAAEKTEADIMDELLASDDDVEMTM
ncbi:nuclear condensing complex subunit [Boeremia exigua]|uniref:nuclear condensing complex subunit n=1 Tax=Boeremia exigua TaxID=749465 RepID=UPI001E8E4C45|nr:nuclear condensing complex subunit [Boeremia exigua]KAH6638917.1 nuclear condensing complex subunit [Boeremia exigua]